MNTTVELHRKDIEIKLYGDRRHPQVLALHKPTGLGVKVGTLPNRAQNESKVIRELRGTLERLPGYVRDSMANKAVIGRRET